MKFTLLITLTTLLTTLHAFPRKYPTIVFPARESRHLRHTNTTIHTHIDPTRRANKKTDVCIKVTLADGSIWDRFCKPAHDCMTVKKPEEAPVAFEMPASTVCTLFRGGDGAINTSGARCKGTPRDFEGSDRDLRPLPIWYTQHTTGWACYDRA
ncbi:hypothetical protein E2P81_ATG11494 [Venturia nashicola]|nr:hypothetical protein E2P81_ATG11494 [Venturia nashicola]